MKWSVKIGEYRGIPVKIHTTFLLIIVWIVASHWFQGYGLEIASIEILEPVEN